MYAFVKHFELPCVWLMLYKEIYLPCLALLCFRHPVVNFGVKAGVGTWNCAVMVSVCLGVRSGHSVLGVNIKHLARVNVHGYGTHYVNESPDKNKTTSCVCESLPCCVPVDFLHWHFEQVHQRLQSVDATGRFFLDICVVTVTKTLLAISVSGWCDDTFMGRKSLLHLAKTCHDSELIFHYFTSGSVSALLKGVDQQMSSLKFQDSFWFVCLVCHPFRRNTNDFISFCRNSKHCTWCFNCLWTQM